MLRTEIPSAVNERTFRDPQGILYQDGERILREIHPEHAEAALAWIHSPLAQRWMQQHRLIATRVLECAPGRPALFEHDRVFFPSFPWEWTPSEWKCAGSLTLDLCEEALESGSILKDATPLNILFAGPEPIFVDVLSFEKRDPKNPLWIAYAQFVRTLLLPLAAYVHLGWPLAACMQRRDGYEPADLAPWLNFRQRWTSPFRSLVALPLLLERRAAKHKIQPGNGPSNVSDEVAALTLRHTIRKARKLLKSLGPPQHASRWSGYTESAFHYEDEDQAAKQEFVRRALTGIRPVHVLDVGANTGVYSRIAAECGAEVVAWDTDLRASDLNWQTAHRDHLRILPLIADFARPTPAIGWRNRECASLLDRARGRFDCILTLGILHHLLVTDQIPLEAILDQLAEISTRWAVVEWIPNDDAQFVSLCRGRDQLYVHLDNNHFLQALSQRFVVRAHEKLRNGRYLFQVEKKT